MVDYKKEVKLSERENQVLHLLSQGKIRKEIALILEISESTARTYIERLKEKFDVSNCIELMHVATKWKYI